MNKNKKYKESLTHNNYYTVLHDIYINYPILRYHKKTHINKKYRHILKTDYIKGCKVSNINKNNFEIKFKFNLRMFKNV